MGDCNERGRLKMNHRTNSNRRKIQALLACLAVFALLFLATESTLEHHHKGSSDATCPVCHIAHHAPIKSATVIKAPVLVLVAHGVLCEVRTPELELIVSEHPSRAPPSA
jgi:hypothetical protein